MKLRNVGMIFAVTLITATLGCGKDEQKTLHITANDQMDAEQLAQAAE